MAEWQKIRSFGLDILIRWESLVGPGIKRLAQQRSREMTKDRKWEINLLRIRKFYLNRKLLQMQNW